MSERRRRLSADKKVKDLQAGDCVRRVGHRGVGFVEAVENGCATVVWKAKKEGERNRDEHIPLACLRRCNPGGSDHDTRRPRI